MKIKNRLLKPALADQSAWYLSHFKLSAKRGRRSSVTICSALKLFFGMTKSSLSTSRLASAKRAFS